MSYTVIAATDTLSATRSVLNGTTTRVAQVEFRDTLDATNPPAASQQGLVKTLDFSTGDIILPTWTICDRVARDVALSLQLDLVTTGAESSRFVAFDLDVVSCDPAAETDLSSATLTVSGADVEVPALSGRAFRYTLAIAASSISSASIKALGLRLTRVAPSGTDASNAVGLYGLSVLAGIDR